MNIITIKISLIFKRHFTTRISNKLNLIFLNSLIIWQTKNMDVIDTVNNVNKNKILSLKKESKLITIVIKPYSKRRKKLFSAPKIHEKKIKRME